MKQHGSPNLPTFSVMPPHTGSFLFKRLFEVPEVWFSALLFPFKLYTVFAVVGPLIWYLMLPMNNGGNVDSNYFMAIDDFRFVASFVSCSYFISSWVLVVGGCIQLFKYSRRAALWTIAFGLLAFLIYIVFERVIFSLPRPI
jgi:hypothetical protein